MGEVNFQERGTSSYPKKDNCRIQKSEYVKTKNMMTTIISIFPGSLKGFGESLPHHHQNFEGSNGGVAGKDKMDPFYIK